MTYTYLSGPEFPQMLNDGYITVVELVSDGGVIIEVSRYSTAEPGDYLNMYWDGRLTSTLSLTDPDTYDWPWRTIVSAQYAPDGPHQAYYTVIDTAQNISASPISAAVIDRAHTTGLPPPIFADASEGTITYALVVQNNGTHIQIPNTTSALAVGDTVYVYWGEYDSQGVSVPDSNTSLTYIVKASDTTASGFTVLVAAPYVTQVDIGTAQAWYSVVPVGTLGESSSTASVDLDMRAQTAYPAPVLPAGNDGWIECTEIVASSGTVIAIPGNVLFTTGGTVVVYWQGYDANGEVSGTDWSESHTLSATDASTGFSTLVPASYITPIGIGHARAWYLVSGVSEPGTSAVTQVNVDSQHCAALPAPVFPAAAGDNTLTQDEINQDNGTDMTVSYPDMVAGDMVTVFWVGYRASAGTPLPDTGWTETRTVTTAEAAALLITSHIPATAITPIDSGHGEGRYQVMFKNGGIASSGVTDVDVAANAANILQMSCTTGAPWFDPTLYIRPMNEVTLVGPAGADIVVALSSASDAWFYTEEGTQTLTLRLDDTGRGSVQVYCFSMGGITVNGYVSTDPSLKATANMTFSDWLPGQGALQYYGTSSGAVSDGITVCSVYVKSDPTASVHQARLSLTGTSSAIIPISGGQSAYVDISAYGAGAFDVTDLNPEIVNFTLSLPGSSESYVVGSVAFTSFSL